VRQAWEKYPDAAGALIVSPSPYGTCADLAAITDICQQRGKPLMVDEAWGGHLPFHESACTRWERRSNSPRCFIFKATW
jgi:arginine decarboxylase